MRRLVYNPKAYVYTKRRDGKVIDLSHYVVEGTIRRKLDQVSSANIILRNPNNLFTTGGSKTKGESKGSVTFYPMDPVTIYLERLAGYPVRVFTGFLDSTPYYEMYPGTVELTASCTLKKLLYTYYDAGLPYMERFMKEHGWGMTPQGEIWNEQALAEEDRAPTANPKDSSLAQLLFATMTRIGGWNEDTIYIEALPKDLMKRMVALHANFAVQATEARKELEEWMARIVGESSYGQAGGGTGNSLDFGNTDVPRTVYCKGVSMGASELFLLTAMTVGLQEAGGPGAKTFGNPDHGTGSSVGWRQEIASYGSVAERMNVKNSAKRFFDECAKEYSPGDSVAVLGQKVQGAGKDTLAKQMASGNPQKLLDAMVAKGCVSETATASTGTNTPDTSGSGSDSGSTGGAYDPDMTINGRPGEGSSWGNKASKSSDCPKDGTVVSFEGIGVASWIYPYLVWLREQGWTGKVNEGYRTYKYQEYLYSTRASRGPVGAPGTSRHEGSKYPSGAVDLSPGYAEAQELLKKYPGGAKLQGYQVADDPVHFQSGESPSSNPDPSGAGPTANVDFVNSAAKAASFAVHFQLPGILDTLASQNLRGEKALLNDTPLFPFIQQLTTSSLRRFQSLPDGSFYAFFPDYFGESKNHPPYWLIDDIEILDGKIELNDDTLVTHMYVVGDNTGQGNEAINMQFTAGITNIFNAFVGDTIVDTEDVETQNDPTGTTLDPGFAKVLDYAEALAFLRRYGARPLMERMPMIRSTMFEFFFSYQRFMQSWSSQFATDFTFTFMPELFPGGKVGFPNHGLQMFIEEVTHTWGNENGFTTQAVLTSPAQYGKEGQVPPYMVKALSR